MSVIINGREFYVIDVIKGEALWVTEATKEELEKINNKCKDWKIDCKWNR